jgi:hypothetical protein
VRDLGAGALLSRDAAVLALAVVNALHFAISARYLVTTVTRVIVVYLPAYISDLLLYTNPPILHNAHPYAHPCCSYTVMIAIHYFFSLDSAIIFPDLANWLAAFGRTQASVGESIATLSIAAGRFSTPVPPAASIAAYVIHSENRSHFRQVCNAQPLIVNDVPGVGG